MGLRLRASGLATGDFGLRLNKDLKPAPKEAEAIEDMRHEAHDNTWRGKKTNLKGPWTILTILLSYILFIQTKIQLDSG